MDYIDLILVHDIEYAEDLKQARASPGMLPYPNPQPGALLLAFSHAASSPMPNYQACWPDPG